MSKNEGRRGLGSPQPLGLWTGAAYFLARLAEFNRLAAGRRGSYLRIHRASSGHELRSAQLGKQADVGESPAAAPRHP
eukprot:COSAG03_NODE_805_length_5785_cov_2.177278_5_plen_78_part_00